MPFSALGLSPDLIRAVVARNYAEPTPVQAAAIPAVLAGRDVWAQAQTGSGKTAAFALPILQRWLAAAPSRQRGLFALVLVPTRELAAQVGESFTAYAAGLPVRPKIVTVSGGVSINPQMMALRGRADIIVATPGRLLDLVDHNAARLDATATLVLDEADRLFDLGFAEELGRILKLLPAARQNLLFSATYPPAVDALANDLLTDPVRIAVESTVETTPDIQERAIEVDAPNRTQLLRHLIETHGWTRVLVFVATKYATEHVAEKLRRAGIAAAPLHGQLSQGARTKALADFKDSKLQVLVATDLAARGLDIAQLPAVVNHDLPRSPADYTHRIGRTARAGESGVAVSFVTAATHAHFRLIEKRHARAIPREQIPGFEPVEVEPPPLDPNGGVKGKRKSKKDKLREAAARAADPQSTPAPRAAPASPPPRPRRSSHDGGGGVRGERPAAARESDPAPIRWHRMPAGRRRLEPG
ncbi:MAG: DEAD/DEAH box helicase [Verrucomicrobiota bacterium]